MTTKTATVSGERLSGESSKMISLHTSMPDMYARNRVRHDNDTTPMMKESALSKPLSLAAAAGWAGALNWADDIESAVHSNHGQSPNFGV